MFDITAIGELLIDFTPAGCNENGIELYGRNPGGAPANVLAAGSRLGGKTAFIGKVGTDGFGQFLKHTLLENGINADGLVMTDKVHTTLAFVQLDERGDRSFSFYRKPGADIMLEPQEVSNQLLKDTHILHFGSVSLTDEPSRSAVLTAAKKAKEYGALISYDPNYRAPLWDNEQNALLQMKAALAYADIIKVSEEELLLLTGKADLKEGAQALQNVGVSLVLVTLGARGAFYMLGDMSGILPTYDVPTIDTNGAGDAFTGAVLFCLKDKTAAQIRNMNREELEHIVDFANATGSLATTRHGAIPAMPTLQEVLDCIRSTPKLKR